jgi:hypothetical protein
MPKVTNAFTTYQAKGNREDLADAIFNIDPVDTIFLSMSETRSISNVMFDWQTEKLPTINAGNAQVEGFTLVRGPSTPTIRIGNVAQISERDATVSGTQEHADAAGKSGEMSHQMALAGKALKRDMETILLGVQPYNAGADDTTGRTTRGLEHWLTTNAFYGATGANPVSATTAVTDGTPRAFTEALLGDAIQATYDKGGEPDHLLMGSYIKRVFSTFLGRSQSRVAIDKDEINAAADFYLSDFGELKAYPSRYIRPRTVIGWDPDFTKVAYYRKMEKVDIAKIGDADTKMILSEYGLQVSNEAAHFKIADLITSGAITLAGTTTQTTDRVIGGVHGTAVSGETEAYNADGSPKMPPANRQQPFDAGGTPMYAGPYGGQGNINPMMGGALDERGRLRTDVPVPYDASGAVNQDGTVLASPGSLSPVTFPGQNPGAERDPPPPPASPKPATPPAATGEQGSSPGTLLVTSAQGNPSEVTAKTPAGTKGSIVWGDATPDDQPKNGLVGVKHTYETPGDYTVRLVDEGGVLIASASVHVPV